MSGCRRLHLLARIDAFADIVGAYFPLPMLMLILLLMYCPRADW